MQTSKRTALNSFHKQYVCFTLQQVQEVKAIFLMKTKGAVFSLLHAFPFPDDLEKDSPVWVSSVAKRR